ncbi:5-formyltetrahydrofolate cyclo-ligase [Clostridium omnivorum]|uniref:5-formyltetrahydrofolate cyclo-ligase n=1 Tax=Clostridium omnivorum TaxID=1604902 RepID=A0ABQ5NAN0_9CLOT|nr:5-formyltetrahydrofolate cyclo-ligase [Clostridium sp. E14]GLC32151.1 5-formyltetrahydrofolate cyclo-ligase [Clostridium sp. E14]
MNNLDKKQIRNNMKTMRSNLHWNDKAKMDTIIFEKVINSDAYQRSKVIFIYVSYNNEVATHRIIEHGLSNNKVICVPKIISLEQGMKSIRINSFDELRENSMGILEPLYNGIEVKPNEVDLLLMPGLAFDSKGGRLGYGGGFYDKYLRKCRQDSVKIGLCYDFQLIDSVPTSELDELVDEVITN